MTVLKLPFVCLKTAGRQAMNAYQPLTIANVTRTILLIWACLLFTGCQPSTQTQQNSPSQQASPKIRPTIDPALKLIVSAEDWSHVNSTAAYKQLPEIALSVDTTPLVTPEREGATIPIDAIPTNASIRVLGSDQDTSWLLILYQGIIGWVPAFYAHTRLGGFKLPVVSHQSAACSSFLAVSADSDHIWNSSVRGTVRVQGIIYRPEPTPLSDTEILSVNVVGSGSAGKPVITHMELNDAGELLIFAVDTKDLEPQSQVRVQVTTHAQEPSISQVAFFQNNYLTAGEQVNGTVTASSSLNVRRGPGTVYKPPIGKLKQGATFTLQGWARDANGDIWWSIETASGLNGWIHSSYVQEESHVECVPEIIDLPPI